MDQDAFLKELMRLNQKASIKNKKEKDQMSEFNQGFMNGLTANFSPQMQEEAKMLLSGDHTDSLIDSFSSGISGSATDFFESLMDKFSERTGFSFENFHLDPVDLFNQYYTLKAKHQKYQESEDINNF